ncbi:hypothetical protein [Phaeobacter sp. 22II1-1F12B]|uniref:hypothetical protein n=1 Tax=Phaeobacter sp. 22II1-1F12B TaxID=1317111 RepID=UPI001184805D|nr:hypothetical protein [Phaeobacter sp. 22II1-1F12B]
MRKIAKVTGFLLTTGHLFSCGAVPDENFFPIPAPRPSSSIPLSIVEISEEYGATTTLFELEETIRGALQSAGYFDVGTLSTPEGGIAIITPVEQITSSGTPVEGAQRWVADINRSNCGSFSLSCFLKALFLAPEGLYRVLVIVATDEPLRIATNVEFDQETMETLMGARRLDLNPDLSEISISKEHDVYLLVYEFSSTSPNEMLPEVPGRIGIIEHLNSINLASLTQ